MNISKQVAFVTGANRGLAASLHLNFYLEGQRFTQGQEIQRLSISPVLHL